MLSRNYSRGEKKAKVSHVLWTLRLWPFLIKKKMWLSDVHNTLTPQKCSDPPISCRAHVCFQHSSPIRKISCLILLMLQDCSFYFSASQHIITLTKTQPRLYCSATDSWLSDAVCIKNRDCGKEMKTVSRNPFIPNRLAECSSNWSYLSKCNRWNQIATRSTGVF